MPSISLFTHPVVPEASHDVRAPGGYERWRFIALDQATGCLLIATFSDGDVNDEEYRRRVRKFFAHPTRTMPPSPRDFASIGWSVFDRDENQLASDRERVHRDVFIVSNKILDLRAGLSSFQGETLNLRSATSHARLNFLGHLGEGRVLDVHGKLTLKNETANFVGVGTLLHRFDTKLPIESSTDAILATDRLAAPLAVRLLT